MSKNTDTSASAPTAQTLLALCSGLLPVWLRHLAASRSQSETAVSDMMQAFSGITPHVQQAEQQSRQIADVLGSQDSPLLGLGAACEAALAPLLHHAQLPAGGAQAIASALALVHQAVATIEPISQPLSRETHAVAEHVERMYIGFQYQDRISQMIALLEADMARLQALVDGSSADIPDLQSWLAQLEDQYAMAEQRQNHVGTHAGSPGAGMDQETTFF